MLFQDKKHALLGPTHPNTEGQIGCFTTHKMFTWSKVTGPGNLHVHLIYEDFTTVSLNQSDHIFLDERIHFRHELHHHMACSIFLYVTVAGCQFSFKIASLPSIQIVVQKTVWIRFNPRMNHPLIIRDITHTDPLKSPVTVMCNRL